MGGGPRRLPSIYVVVVLPLDYETTTIEFLYSELSIQVLWVIPTTNHRRREEGGGLPGLRITFYFLPQALLDIHAVLKMAV
jgi:hypothetical protein